MNIIRSRFLAPITLGLLLTACTSSKMARYDAFDQAEISQSRGNYVSGRFFGKTVLAVNPRVESRRVGSVTNTAIEWKTNVVTTRVTNLVITLSTNQASAVSTNDLPPAPLQASESAAEESGDGVAGEGNEAGEPTEGIAAQSGAPTNRVIALPLTNYTASSGLSVSSIAAAGGFTESIQKTDGLNTQISVVTNNQMVTTQFNQVVTLETNMAISVLTNQIVEAVTNTTVIAINEVVADHYLVTELIAPSDFVLAPSESLVLLVDGKRMSFSATNSIASFVGRRGFASTLYRVPEGTFQEIADAEDVRVRLRGVNSVIDREMPRSARKEFARFGGKPEHSEADEVEEEGGGSSASPHR